MYVTKRVLMMSHGFTGVTGFSNQLYLQGRALIEDGYEVYMLHRDYRGEPLYFPKGCGAKMQSGRPIDGFWMLPNANDQWAQDILPWYINRYQIDYVHTLGDIWCYQYIKQIPRHRAWKWLGHYVFDTENCVGFWNDSIRNADISVVPSKNSYKMLENLGHKNIKYVPHGINVERFKPATSEERSQWRKEWAIPDDVFVIGMVAHNQYRKQVDRLVDAFANFYKQNPKSMMIFHCLPVDQTGWNLPQILKDLGLSNRVAFTDKAGKGIGDVHNSEEEMRKLYCVCDVHALPTAGEGFGVPAIESMACGIPTVMTDYTTAKEFFCREEKDGDKIKYINERGFPVPYENIERHQTGGLWAKVNIKALTDTLQYVKDNQSEAKQMAMKGMKFVRENYNEELIKNKWKELYKDFDAFAEGTVNVEEEMKKLRLLKTN